MIDAVQILVADDDDIAAEMVTHTLTQFGYEVTSARSGREALKLMRTGLFHLVILDWEMADMTGLDVCRHIRQRYSSSYIYCILLTSRSGTQNVVEGLNAGADDFITKPFEPQELIVRIRTGERILSLVSHELMIFSLAKLTESRDKETGAHLERIREYCQVLAGHLSREPEYRDRVDGDFVQLIYLTSPLHDIGKVGIPDAILLKPGPLTSDEFEVMKQHTVIGSRTLDAALSAHPEAKFLCMARDIARSHHERYNGSGYPDGLVGDEIPLSGQIVGLADVYDALTSKRVYKKSFSHEQAREMILDENGNHFNPDIVRAFLVNEDLFVEIHEKFSEQERMELQESEALSLLEPQVLTQ
ncbi:MAG: response regulator [Pirellulales bacterium]|nr:response regulator [Pirellulales bacterium]